MHLISVLLTLEVAHKNKLLLRNAAIRLLGSSSVCLLQPPTSGLSFQTEFIPIPVFYRRQSECDPIGPQLARTLMLPLAFRVFSVFRGPALGAEPLQRI